MFSKMNSHLHRIRSALLQTTPPPSLFLSILITDSFASSGGLSFTFTAIQLLLQHPHPPKTWQNCAHTVLRLNTRFSFIFPFIGAVYGLKAFPVKESFHQSLFLGLAQHVMCNSLIDNFQKAGSTLADAEAADVLISADGLFPTVHLV